MASELVNSATNEKLPEVDWAKNIEICELVAHDQRQAKDVIKAIKKRLSSKSANAQLYAVMLLEMLLNNIGEPVHKQVIEAGLLPLLVKIVKKKSDLPVRERIFLLLDATQTSVGGASGKFPQYYNAYYELVSAGVKFPQRSPVVSSDPPSSGAREDTPTVANIASASGDRAIKRDEPQPAPGSSILEKASTAFEVLREVLDAVDAQNPQAAKDEFTLDLVEQCSSQKDRVMHLVMSCRDERLLSQAIELNEQLGRILARHEALFSRTPASIANHVERPEQSIPISNDKHAVRGTWATNHSNHVHQPIAAPNHFEHDEIEEEEEAEQLSHRIRKGKAHVRPEDEEESRSEKPLGSIGSAAPSEALNRPLIRPLTLESPTHETRAPPLATSLPPPPAKHVEREKFFQEKKGDGFGLAGHVRGLSIHSRNSSFTGSFSSND